MYFLTVNNVPTRKAFTAREAWATDAVAGHPTDGEGMCVFEDGRKVEVRRYDLGTDVWRVTHTSGVHYFYGTAKAMRYEHAGLLSADRLEWDGWTTVYGN